MEKLAEFRKVKYNEQMRFSNEIIAIIRREAKELIWKDRGSGADMDGSFYTVQDYAFVQGRARNGTILKDFRFLGDQACGEPHDSGGWDPCGELLLVKDISEKGDILKKPTSAYLLYGLYRMIENKIIINRLI